MNKRVLIISPYFPPSNTADMQRVRMSLPYFRNLGWDAEVVMVDEQYSDMNKDELLLQSVPPTIKIHKVGALNKSWTSKLGLGSIALRSLLFYKKTVSSLLASEKYDLVYFSTTQFPVCILGSYWKKRFNVPYVIDMQDPWHSEYYEDKPAAERPPKYWFSYRLNKYLEPIAMKAVGGLISVSESYINELKKRYPVIKNVPSATITFGAFEPDVEIAVDNKDTFKPILDNKFKNMVYVGRGGTDMHRAVTPLFEAFANGLKDEPELFNRLKLYFIGTSYAANGQGKQTIMPLAKKYQLQNHVIEITDRISYYHTLATLTQSDALFIPGSDDPAYTASKIYPYLLTKKPLLAIFNPQSPAMQVLKEYRLSNILGYNEENIQASVTTFLKRLLQKEFSHEQYNAEAQKKYSAQNMVLQQCNLFNKVING